MLQTQLWCNSKLSKFTTHPALGLTSHHNSRINIDTSELDQAGISSAPLNSCYNDHRLSLHIVTCQSFDWISNPVHNDCRQQGQYQAPWVRGGDSSWMAIGRLLVRFADNTQALNSRCASADSKIEHKTTLTSCLVPKNSNISATPAENH